LSFCVCALQIAGNQAGSIAGACVGAGTAQSPNWVTAPYNGLTITGQCGAAYQPPPPHQMTALQLAAIGQVSISPVAGSPMFPNPGRGARCVQIPRWPITRGISVTGGPSSAYRTSGPWSPGSCCSSIQSPLGIAQKI
jgi:hypothetical protein